MVQVLYNIWAAQARSEEGKIIKRGGGTAGCAFMEDAGSVVSVKRDYHPITPYLEQEQTTKVISKALGRSDLEGDIFNGYHGQRNAVMFAVLDDEGIAIAFCFPGRDGVERPGVGSIEIIIPSSDAHFINIKKAIEGIKSKSKPLELNTGSCPPSLIALSPIAVPLEGENIATFLVKRAEYMFSKDGPIPPELNLDVLSNNLPQMLMQTVFPTQRGEAVESQFPSPVGITSTQSPFEQIVVPKDLHSIRHTFQRAQQPVLTYAEEVMAISPYDAAGDYANHQMVVFLGSNPAPISANTQNFMNQNKNLLPLLDDAAKKEARRLQGGNKQKTQERDLTS